jgi:squalene synthase HpnC
MTTVLEHPKAAEIAEGRFWLDETATMAKAGAENFPVALFLLPRRVRAHLLAVYGFARAVDDLGDLAEGDRLAKLDAFAHAFDEALRGASAHPLVSRAAEMARATGADRSLFARLVEANRKDQVQHRYESFDELLGYCELSANPVGRLVLAAFGVHDERAKTLSDRICTGLQLVEHWQDVAEDRRAGRVYLPAEDLRCFGVTEADLDASVASPALRRLIAFEAGRARDLLLAGAPLIGRVPGRARVAVAGFVGGGLAQIEAMELARYDVLGTTVKASKVAVAARALALLVDRSGWR